MTKLLQSPLSCQMADSFGKDARGISFGRKKGKMANADGPTLLRFNRINAFHKEPSLLLIHRAATEVWCAWITITVQETFSVSKKSEWRSRWRLRADICYQQSQKTHKDRKDSLLKTIRLHQEASPQWTPPAEKRQSLPFPIPAIRQAFVDKQWGSDLAKSNLKAEFNQILDVKISVRCTWY